MMHFFTVEYYLAIKNEIMKFSCNWIEPEKIMASNIIHIQKEDIYSMY